MKSRNFDKFRHEKKGGDDFHKKLSIVDYENVKIPPKDSINHDLIYVRVTPNIGDDFHERVWDKPCWTKKMIFDKITETKPNWYSIEIFSLPKNSSLDDIFWKNPNYKIDNRKITKLPSEFK